MKERKQRTKVTESTFNAVKIMLNGGATAVEIAEYLKLGTTTIFRMKSAQSWEEYKQVLAAIAVNTRKKEQEKKIPVQEQKEPVKDEQPVKAEQTVKSEQPLATNYQINRMVEEMKLMNEHLKLISNKIAFIVDQLA